MAASGRAKAARRHVFRDQGDVEDLSPALQRYMRKKIDRLMNNFANPNYKGSQSRMFPCQKINGKFAYLDIDAKPTFNEDDGLWYLDGELVVSKNYTDKMKPQKSYAIVNADGSVTDHAVIQMEPQTLGE